jgi:hypothetical protein
MIDNQFELIALDHILPKGQLEEGLVSNDWNGQEQGAIRLNMRQAFAIVDVLSQSFMKIGDG